MRLPGIAQMNPTFDEIPHYASKRISEAVANDPDVLRLSIGEPWFGPPKRLGEFLVQVAADPNELAPLVVRYPDSLGLPRLRRAIAGSPTACLEVPPKSGT